VVPLPPDRFDEFVPYLQFARAAYCGPEKIAGWQCGDACSALPGFLPTLRGGDGGVIQYFYVGFWPDQSAIVVAHQGTDPLKIIPVITDIDLELMEPDPALFPNLPSGIEVHSGFAVEHKKTAPQILAEVKKLMAEHSSNHVILIGHSLGGALAELDTLYMKLNLPEGTTIQGVTFGTPRVGNPAWATFFDSQITQFIRLNNKRDPVPTVPGRRLGFRHPRGEIHIQRNGLLVACLGPDERSEPECSNGMVRNILEGRILDHFGPYHDIFLGRVFCTP